MVLFDGSVCGETPAAGQRAAQLWGLLGARGRSELRVGLSGLCALPISGRSLSVSGGSGESEPRVWRLAFTGGGVLFAWFFLMVLFAARRRRRGSGPPSYGVFSARAGAANCA